MNFIALHLIAYFACFFLLWFGAGRVVGAVTILAKSWGMPRFTLSFFVLGLLTSLPEMTIGTIAVINQTPRIFAGNLLGATFVLFLGIIPLLSILGKGVKFPVKQVSHRELLMILTVVLAPMFLSIDQRISYWEGWFFVMLYVTLAAVITFRQSVFEKMQQVVSRNKPVGVSALGNIGLGVLVLIVASRQIVTSTLFFAEAFSISPFIVSMLLVAIGTNIPEISIIFRALLAKKVDIALADYLGSASANTLIFGLLTILNGVGFDLPGQSLLRFWFLAVGLTLFFFFARSRDTLSRKEGSVLFLMYGVFIAYEIWLSRQI